MITLTNVNNKTLFNYKSNQNKAVNSVNLQKNNYGDKINFGTPLNKFEKKKLSKLAKIIYPETNNKSCITKIQNVLKSSSVRKKEEEFNKIPKELQKSFLKLFELDGKELLNESYKEMLKYLKLPNAVPVKDIIIAKQEGVFQAGGHNFLTLETSFPTELAKPSKYLKITKIILGAHEAKHFSDGVNIFRTEGITISEISNKLADNDVKKIAEEGNILDALGDVNVKNYKLALKKGKKEAATFLDKVKNHNYDYYNKKLTETYSSFINKLPKIKANSKEGKKSKELLNAFVEYEGVGLVGMGNKKYYENLLEKEAYGFQNKIEKYFNTFMDMYYCL